MNYFLKHSHNIYFFFNTDTQKYCTKSINNQTALQYKKDLNARTTTFLKAIPYLDFNKVKHVSQL